MDRTWFHLLGFRRLPDTYLIVEFPSVQEMMFLIDEDLLCSTSCLSSNQRWHSFVRLCKLDAKDTAADVPGTR